MTKKLIMILGLVLSSMLMKAQAFFVPFPKAGDKYWQKQVPVAMRNDYIRLGNLYQKKPWWGIPAHYPKDHPEKDPAGGSLQCRDGRHACLDPLYAGR